MLPLLVNSKPGAYMATLTLNALDGVFMPGVKVTIRDVTILAPLVGVVFDPGAPAWVGCIYCTDLSPEDLPPGTDPCSIARRYGAEDFTSGLVGGVGRVAISDSITEVGGRIRYHLSNPADFGKVVVTFQVG